MTKLEQEVLDIINETICGKYIGKLKVDIFDDFPDCGDPPCRELTDRIYQLKLYLDREFTPVVLSYEGTEEEFKKFIKKEFKERKMERTKFYKITREPIIWEDDDLMDWDDE